MTILSVLKCTTFCRFHLQILLGSNVVQIVISFNLWQTFRQKKSFILLDKEFSEKKLGHRLTIRKLIHPSVIYELWSPCDIQYENNSQYQALESQSSLHKNKLIHWQQMYPFLTNYGIV